MPIKNLQSDIDKSTNYIFKSTNQHSFFLSLSKRSGILDVLPNARTLTLTREGNWTESLVTAMFPREADGTRDKLLSAWSSCKIHLSDHKHLGQGKHGSVYRQGQEEEKKIQTYINQKNS